MKHDETVELLREWREAIEHAMRILEFSGDKDNLIAASDLGGVLKQFDALLAQSNAAPDPEQIDDPSLPSAAPILDPSVYDETDQHVATAPASGKGWKLVPREPTEAMIDAVADSDDPEDQEEVAAMYRAMLAAVKEPK